MLAAGMILGGIAIMATAHPWEGGRQRAGGLLLIAFAPLFIWGSYGTGEVNMRVIIIIAGWVAAATMVAFAWRIIDRSELWTGHWQRLGGCALLFLAPWVIVGAHGLPA